MRKKNIRFEGKNNVFLTCRIAMSFFDKTKGLMHVKSMRDTEGMFFWFRFSWWRFFWMKDVFIPLDIIFINKDFNIIKICAASIQKGLIPGIYFSGGLCKFVIECNKGFCRKNDIVPGVKVLIDDY